MGMSEQEAKSTAMKEAVDGVIHSESLKSPIRNAFQQGWDAAKRFYEGEYQRGLNDAWKTARRILGIGKDNIPFGDRKTIFGICDSYNVVEELDVKEAMRRIQKWEEINAEKAEEKPHWLYDSRNALVKCSICGQRAYTGTRAEWIRSPYCPSCGTKMEESNE